MNRRQAVLSFVVFALPVALFASTVPSAEAQMAFGRQWETNVSLTQADMNMIKATLDQKIHGQPAGVSATWTNPTTGNSGTITLLRVFGRQGQRCEQIDYQMGSSSQGRSSDRYDLVSCLQPDGAWKLAY